MNIEWIMTYLDIMETRNFNATSERLGLTQSTVSHRMHKLEEALGQRLFARGRSGAHPTAAGVKFETPARNLQREWQKSKRMFLQDKYINGEVRIGLQYDIAHYYAGAIIISLRNEFPKFAHYVEVDYSMQMTQDVLNGNLDAALIFSPKENSDLHYEELTKMDYVMVASEQTSLASVTSENYIFPNYSPKFAAEHRALLADLDRCILTAGQADAISQFLVTVGGAGYLPQIALRERGDFHIVKNAPIISQQVYFCTHVKNKRLAHNLKIKKVLSKPLIN